MTAAAEVGDTERPALRKKRGSDGGGGGEKKAVVVIIMASRPQGEGDWLLLSGAGGGRERQGRASQALEGKRERGRGGVFVGDES